MAIGYDAPRQRYVGGPKQQQQQQAGTAAETPAITIQPPTPTNVTTSELLATLRHPVLMSQIIANLCLHAVLREIPGCPAPCPNCLLLVLLFQFYL
uniref:Uncharacterized protein n=1 Tax=Anopheles farauti TaxID=69004 RepID=A0A182QME6_9DIPT